jgi:hypothetical protein
MHKYLCPGRAQVNHKNGNGLDNTRENLRGRRSGWATNSTGRDLSFPREWRNAAINSRLYFDQKSESGLDDPDAP